MNQKPLQTMAETIRRINAKNGWGLTHLGDFHTGGDKIPCDLALIHSEVSEALEAYRVGDYENFVEEMADTLIRVLDLVGGLTTDFDAAVNDKLEKNKSRGHRHGGKRV